MPEWLHYKNPRGGETVSQVPVTSAQQMTQCLAEARVALKQWGNLTHAERGAQLHRLVDMLEDSKSALAKAEASDTGKCLVAAEAEIAAGLDIWRFAADLAHAYQVESFEFGDRYRGCCYHGPVGVVGMILPWNYPFITAAERLPFALAAGCTVLVKPSELAQGALGLMVDLLQGAEFIPEGVIQLLYGPGEALCGPLIRDPMLDMVAYVGSTRVGMMLQALAEQHQKRYTAEMGGNNFVLVYPGVDLERVAHAIVANGFVNAGQACIAGTHVLVVPELMQALTNQLSLAMDQLVTQRETADLDGRQPMITQAKADQVMQQIDACLTQGAGLIGALEQSGQWISPVILTDVALNDALMQEEIFAPVITVSPCESAQFLEVAESSGYGLALYVWTPCKDQQQALINRASFGRIWINSGPIVWDPRLPVGGFGRSGAGRDMGNEGLLRYSVTKSVVTGYE